jgi:hypothetical protein
MAQAPDTLAETIVADGAVTRSEPVHEGLMAVCLARQSRLAAGAARPDAPSQALSLQSEAVSSATMLAVEAVVRPGVHAKASRQQAGRMTLSGGDSFRVATAGYSS